MAYTHGSVSVGTAATQIVAVQNTLSGILVQNNGASPVFVGGATVTTSGATQGVQVAANASLLVPGAPGDVLYGVVASGTATVAFLTA